MSTPLKQRWTLEAGRVICLDGIPALVLRRVVDNGPCPVSPLAADIFVAELVRLLNYKGR